MTASTNTPAMEALKVERSMDADVEQDALQLLSLQNEGRVGGDLLFAMKMLQALEAQAVPATLEDALNPAMAAFLLTREDVRSLRLTVQGKRDHWMTTRFGDDSSDFLEKALAIHAYTLECPKIYEKMNSSMFAKDRVTASDELSDALKAWVPYIKLLYTALLELPAKYHYAGPVWRGLKWHYPSPTSPDPERHFPRDGEIFFYEFRSTTTNEHVARTKFCGTTDQTAGQLHGRTLFHIETSCGYRIKDFSYFANEDEVLIPPLCVFRIASVTVNPGEPDVVEMQQIGDLDDVQRRIDDALGGAQQQVGAAEDWHKAGNEAASSGSVEVQGKQYTQKRCYELSLKSNPYHQNSWYNLAMLRGGTVQGRFFNKEQCLERCLQIDKRDTNAWWALAKAGGGTVDDEALTEAQCYERILDLNPQISGAWRNLGNLGGGVVGSEQVGKKQCYEHALGINPESSVVWTCLGRLGGGLVGSEKVNKKQCYEYAVKNNPQSSTAWDNLGREGGGIVGVKNVSKRQCFERATEIRAARGQPAPEETCSACAVT